MTSTSRTDDSRIPLSEPHLAGNEWSYVKECLDTGWVSSGGGFVRRFEEDLARTVGARDAVACVNGTAALQVALQVAGVEAGDEVLVPTVTFIATVNAVHYLHASPVFFDCDAHYNLDAAQVLDFLERETVARDGATRSRSTGARIRAVLPVHVFGNAASLESLMPACRERGIAVIEDAAEALGTRYRSGALAPSHAGTVGRVGVFSFNGNKILTTGGGGMIVSGDAALADRARYLTTQAKDDPVRYVHAEVGYNFRLTNVQAALGVAQLEQLPGFLERKREFHRRYREGLAGREGLALVSPPDHAECNHWLSPVRIDAAAYGEDRERVMARLATRGIETRPLWELNHRQRPYRGFRALPTPRAERLHAETLLLPSSVGMSPDQQDRVIEALLHG